MTNIITKFNIRTCKVILLSVMSFLAMAFSWIQPLETDIGLRVGLSGYHLTDAILIESVHDNASGLTYNAETQTLFMVVNEPEAILELNKKGQVIRKIELEGYHDTEGIIHLGEDRFAIIEERKRRLSFIEITDETRHIQVSQHFYDFQNVEGTFDNRGIEGLTYDIERKRFYVSNESHPKQMWALPNPMLATNVVAQFELWDAEQSALHLLDYAGVHLNRQSGHLLLLSEKSSRLVEVTLQGHELGRLELGLIRHPEGITMDDEGVIYICSEPNMLYIYRKSKA